MIKLTDRRRAALGRFGRQALLYILLTCLAYVIVYPVFGRIMYSFMTAADLNDDTVFLFTKHFTLDNYIRVAAIMDYGASLLRTVGVVALNCVLQVSAAAVTAYGLARFRFPGRGLLFFISILTLIIPPQILTTPLYFRFIDLLNTPIPTALLCATGLGLKSALLIFMLRQYFAGFPRELEEAASIDGAGPIRTFLRVALPSAGTMLTTVFLFSVVWQWTDNFYPSVFDPTTDYLPLVITRVYNAVKAATEHSGTVDVIGQSLLNNAAYLLFILPLLVIFLIGQRYFVESVERSGIVG